MSKWTFMSGGYRFSVEDGDIIESTSEQLPDILFVGFSVLKESKPAYVWGSINPRKYKELSCENIAGTIKISPEVDINPDDIQPFDITINNNMHLIGIELLSNLEGTMTFVCRTRSIDNGEWELG
jgi:hypothetical protein